MSNNFSGMKYSSPDQPTRGHEMIQRITSSNPDDRESPFWDENSEFKFIE